MWSWWGPHSSWPWRSPRPAEGARAAEERPAEEGQEDAPTSRSQGVRGDGGNAESAESYHPDQGLANRGTPFNDNAVFHSRPVSNAGKTITGWAFRGTEASEPEAGSTGANRDRETPGEQLPDIFMEGDPLPNSNTPPSLHVPIP